MVVVQSFTTPEIVPIPDSQLSMIRVDLGWNSRVVLTPAIGVETITLFVRTCLSSITLASVLLTPRGRQPDLQMDPSYDLFLQLDVPFSVLREIVGMCVGNEA